MCIQDPFIDLTTTIEDHIIDLIMIDRDMITDLTVHIDLTITMVMADQIIMVDQMVMVLDREMETIMVVVLIDRVVIETKKNKKQPLWLLFL
jgi:hypothetical protein